MTDLATTERILADHGLHPADFLAQARLALRRRDPATTPEEILEGTSRGDLDKGRRVRVYGGLSGSPVLGLEVGLDHPQVLGHGAQVDGHRFVVDDAPLDAH